MSTFFSNRYLKFRRLIEGGEAAGTIARDVPCGHCNYNLRGLKPGRVCPECGHVIPNDVVSSTDPLLAGDPDRRSMTMWGFTLMACSVFGAVALRIGSAALWAFVSWPTLPIHAAMRLAIALAWSIGVCMALPRSVDLGRPGRRTLRHFAVASQFLWIPSAACWLLSVTPGFAAIAMSMRNWSHLLSAPAMIGAVGVALLLSLVADDIELDEAPRRIGVAIWTVPVLTVVLLFVPRRVGFITLALFGPLLLAWCWYMIAFARGAWEFRQYVDWGMRQAGDVGDRAARIARTRAELEREAAAQVRTLPVPPHAPPTTPQPRRT